MSKSLGNTISPAEMLELASPRVVRYFLGQAHYRSQLDYRPESLAEAAAAVERIDGFVANALARIHGVGPNDDFSIDMHHFEVTEAFESAMNDDLNVPSTGRAA